nr:disease resistance protein RRS1B-like [Ziziphus jujuba var. spinosa]
MTTIAKAVFKKFAIEFEGSCFLTDVREMSKQQFGLVQLQEMLLFDMLANTNLKVGNTQRCQHYERKALAQKDDDKSIFLDVACFFVGLDKDFVIQVLGSSNFCPIIGMGVLTDMSLIKIEFNKLRVHPLIQEVGKEIVRQESLEAGKHSRLWSLDEVIHVFPENEKIYLHYVLFSNSLYDMC